MAGEKSSVVARLAVALALGGMLSPAWGSELQRLLEAARTNDASYRAAQQELASGRQVVPLARAGLLPSLSFSASDAMVRGSRTAPNFLGQSVTSDLDYRAPQYSLNLRMPLYNADASRRVKQAESQSAYSELVFAVRTADLLERLGTAYFQNLYAADLVRSAQSQVALAQAQAELAQRREQRGEGTRPEVAEAQASLDAARVQLREAEDQLSNARLALQHVSGPQAGEPAAAPRAAAMALPPLQPASLEAWVTRALSDNSALRARRQAVDVARAAVERAGAGHHPRLDLVAGMSTSRNDSVSSLNQSSRQNSLGLQLNVPIYAGGSVDATITQALAEQGKAEAELEAEERSVTREVQRFFLSVSQGGARLGAGANALAAARLSAQGARRLADGGLATEADVLAAQRRVSEAERELARIRYEDLLARLRLLLRAGVDAAEVASAIDSLMGTPARSSAP